MIVEYSRIDGHAFIDITYWSDTYDIEMMRLLTLCFFFTFLPVNKQTKRHVFAALLWRIYSMSRRSLFAWRNSNIKNKMRKYELSYFFLNSPENVIWNILFSFSLINQSIIKQIIQYKIKKFKSIQCINNLWHWRCNCFAIALMEEVMPGGLWVYFMVSI